MNFNGGGPATSEWGLHQGQNEATNEFSVSADIAGIEGNPEDIFGGAYRGGGLCFNCGLEGHMKSDCPNARSMREFTGECRLCAKEGHRAADCPDAGPRLCKNCGQEGHANIDCKNARVIDRSTVVTVKPEIAWDELKAAAAQKPIDLDDIKEAVAKYLKGMPDTTYVLLEEAFRAQNIGVYIIAQERELAMTYTNMDLQGVLDRKFTISYRTSPKAMRPKEQATWPSSPEENMERLKDAGLPVDRLLSMCTNCNKLGHSRKFCTEEKQENADRTIVTCVYCSKEGHRARDCPDPRTDRFACRNCKQSGHNSKECPEPRSAEGVECKKCNEVGHFARDCPTGGGGDRKCNNCDEEGHMSRECPKPRDYSRVRCSNCQEMGHTKVRCKQPIVSEDVMENAGNGDNDHHGFETGQAVDAQATFESAPPQFEESMETSNW